MILRSSIVALGLLAVACASTPETAADAGAGGAGGAGGGTSTTSGASNAGTSSAPAAAGKSLYDRLGGIAAIDAVVTDFLGNVAGDTRIQHRFALSDLKDLKQKLVDQICAATGGPCKYTGGDMKTVHKGMRVTGGEFTALVEDLIKSLDKFKVPDKEKGELLGALGGMQPDIVEEP